MAYTKQTWASGDTITAAKLNHIEDGIEEAGGERFADYDFVILENVDGYSALKGTFAEVKAKLIARAAPVMGLFFSEWDSGGMAECMSTATMVARYVTSGDCVELYITVQPYNDVPKNIFLTWNANGISD